MGRAIMMLKVALCVKDVNPRDLGKSGINLFLDKLWNYDIVMD
jgi:hypothetical protein